MIPLLDIRNLSVSYILSHGPIHAVRNVSCHISTGETLGLVGESGCGKTTLARTIQQLERPTSGQIFFSGEHIASRPRFRDIQMVFQDPFASLNPRMTILELVTEAAIVHGIVSRSERFRYAQELLADVGLPDDILPRYPHAFSGGQRQRISIARALALRPKLLICDEPVSALDVSVQAQIINLLLELQTRHRLSMLFISHDLSVVQHVAHRIAVMKSGDIVECNTASSIMNHPTHPYTRELLSARYSASPTTPSSM